MSFLYKTLGLSAVLLLLFCVLPTPEVEAYSTTASPYQIQNENYQYQVYTTSNQTYYYNQRLQQLQAQIVQLQRLLLLLQDNIDVDNDSEADDEWYSESEVEIQTRTVTDVKRSSARLRGRVTDFNRSDYADVWFEYGRSRNRLDQRTPIFTIDDNDARNFSQPVVRLRRNSTYYFRTVAEDDRGEKAYGSIRSFSTNGYRYDDDDYYDDEDRPEVSVRSAYEIGYNSVRFKGTVAMNDYRDGEVFFVYGEEEDLVSDVAYDYDSYYDVDEYGDDLRKYRVDSNLDRTSTYRASFSGLDDDTRHYFSLCVGYEDEYDDDTLECSSVRSFTTWY